MRAKSGIDRRKFMQLAAGAVAIGASASCGKVVSPWRSLSADEAGTLSNLCGQIIPEDQDAGAASAGVVNYIDVQLAGRLKRMKKVYREGIAELNDVSVKKYGSRFSGMAEQQQAELLRAIDGDKEWKGSQLQRFFRIVIEHTMQGFYGDPRHGGNRNRVSWTMLRLPYPPIRGRFRADDPVAGRE